MGIIITTNSKNVNIQDQTFSTSSLCGRTLQSKDSQSQSAMIRVDTSDGSDLPVAIAKDEVLVSEEEESHLRTGYLDGVDTTDASGAEDSGVKLPVSSKHGLCSRGQSVGSSNVTSSERERTPCYEISQNAEHCYPDSSVDASDYRGPTDREFSEDRHVTPQESGRAPFEDTWRSLSSGSGSKHIANQLAKGGKESTCFDSDNQATCGMNLDDSCSDSSVTSWKNSQEVMVGIHQQRLRGWQLLSLGRNVVCQAEVEQQNQELVAWTGLGAPGTTLLNQILAQLEVERKENATLHHQVCRLSCDNEHVHAQLKEKEEHLSKALKQLAKEAAVASATQMMLQRKTGLCNQTTLKLQQTTLELQQTTLELQQTTEMLNVNLQELDERTAQLHQAEQQNIQMFTKLNQTELGLAEKTQQLDMTKLELKQEKDLRDQMTERHEVLADQLHHDLKIQKEMSQHKEEEWEQLRRQQTAEPMVQSTDSQNCETSVPQQIDGTSPEKTENMEDCNIKIEQKQTMQYSMVSPQIRPRQAPYVYSHPASRMREPPCQPRPYSLAQRKESFPQPAVSLDQLIQEFACRSERPAKEYGLLYGPEYEELALPSGTHAEELGFLLCLHDGMVVLPHGSLPPKADILDRADTVESEHFFGFLEPHWNIRPRGMVSHSVGIVDQSQHIQDWSRSNSVVTQCETASQRFETASVTTRVEEEVAWKGDWQHQVYNIWSEEDPG